MWSWGWGTCQTFFYSFFHCCGSASHWVRIRILIFTLMRIRILPFTLMRIRNTGFILVVHPERSHLDPHMVLQHFRTYHRCQFGGIGGCQKTRPRWTHVQYLTILFLQLPELACYTSRTQNPYLLFHQEKYRWEKQPANENTTQQMA